MFLNFTRDRKKYIRNNHISELLQYLPKKASKFSSNDK